MRQKHSLRKYFLCLLGGLGIVLSGVIYAAPAFADNEIPPGDLYGNTSYLPEPLPPEPELNPNILNCTQKGYYIYTKEYECPIGDERFLTFETKMRTTFGRHLDWEPEDYINYPPPMPVCPTSGIVITQPDYKPEEKELLQMAADSKEYKALYAEKHASYFLLAELNKLLEHDQENRWWYLLHATWEADNCGNRERYKLYAQKTIEAGKERLKNLQSDNNEYWVLNVVLPDLYRRIGDFRSAQGWLDEFGGKLPEDPKSKESFGVAFELLRQAVLEKNKAQVQLLPDGEQ